MIEERRGHSSSIASRSPQLVVRGEGPTCPQDAAEEPHNELPPKLRRLLREETGRMAETNK
jgi:hypothetical protein